MDRKREKGNRRFSHTLLLLSLLWLLLLLLFVVIVFIISHCGRAASSNALLAKAKNIRSSIVAAIK